MKRTVLFMTCVLAALMMSAQGSNDDFDYVPFVKEGKTWHVVSFSADQSYHFEQFILTNEKVVENGKTYMKMNLNENGLFVLYDVMLLREENRKVYVYYPSVQKESLLFDYSLKEGDTYEIYSVDLMSKVSYKVLSVNNYTEGPEVYRYNYVEEADSTEMQHRYLRKWTVCRTDDNSIQKTWIEGVGSLNGPFEWFNDIDPLSSNNYLAYVVANNDDANGNSYLSFPFHDEFHRVHGCNLPTGEADHSDRYHQLTYELEGGRLHVYGKVFTNCGPNNYAYFLEKPTDDPLVHKIEFVIQDVDPVATCMALHATNFYVSGFDPNMNYIVVDNQGGEHPVINKTPQMAYRPFVENGKAWKVRGYSDAMSNDEWTEYYYFDGDTIVNGQTAKRMLCDSMGSVQNTIGEYVGAWYEQDKKVYYAGNRKQQFELLYDFTLSSGDSIQNPDGTIFVVNKLSGGISGFKGKYYDFGVVRWLEGVGSESRPFCNHPWAFTGHTGVLLTCSIGDEVIYSEKENPFVMGACGRIDFTHTIKIRPKTRIMREEEMTSIYGEYSDQQLGINLDPLDDAYLVSITDETGKAVYEKTVNAGNIVGLNIDISAYAKGRYTVTVENSRDLFTGMFDTQTTGIEEVTKKKAEVRGEIYNLQGQQINSLRKGLNIVRSAEGRLQGKSGQKIYVK